ncbi:trem-like transcript 4 protein isoform X3 [Lutra lutra]|uniref:trem-like transcript 4 protein isoform X3 n=1 Tax=Lutra lutra TaxID=9657 RepID=UPI001FD5B862|nr:trem-like transcript 4 protein isoform X3 [Lutra lutra]
MAWDATCLLPPVLLVLLASGSWGQKPELLHHLEGESFSVKCPYQPQKGSGAVKFWCRWDLPRTCTPLATLPQHQGKPRNSIEDNVRWGYFIVTMTELRVEDSGSYSCGIYKSSRIFFHRNIHLVVSRVSTLRTARSTSGTTAWTSATSPVTDSPQGNWQLIVPSSMLGVLLVLVLILLVILSFRKARRSATKVTGIDSALPVLCKFAVCRQSDLPLGTKVRTNPTTSITTSQSRRNRALGIGRTSHQGRGDLNFPGYLVWLRSTEGL